MGRKAPCFKLNYKQEEGGSSCSPESQVRVSCNDYPLPHHLPLQPLLPPAFHSFPNLPSSPPLSHCWCHCLPSHHSSSSGWISALASGPGHRTWSMCRPYDKVHSGTRARAVTAAMLAAWLQGSMCSVLCSPSQSGALARARAAIR